MNTEALDDHIINGMPDSVKTKHKIGLDFEPSKAITHSGFIAQEVEQAAQEVNFNSSIVYHPTNSNDTYGLGYAEIVVPLVKAVQELSATTDSLKAVTTNQDAINKDLQNQVQQLSYLINTCCNQTQTTGSRTIAPLEETGNNNNDIKSISNSIGVELSDKNIIVLNQNVPNPFAEQTLITFNIPAKTGKVQMLFYNSAGSLIQTADINEKGAGKLTVFANDLSSGEYSYTLVIDGKPVATKKMVKE